MRARLRSLVAPAALRASPENKRGNDTLAAYSWGFRISEGSAGATELLDADGPLWEDASSARIWRG